MFDVETLGTESNSVLLSAAIIHFDFDDQCSYSEFVDRACFVKFDMKEQVTKYKRVSVPDTIKWWEKQSEIPRKLALEPSKQDLAAIDGIEKLRYYIESNGGKEQIFWARGSLDQMVIDSLCRDVGVPVLAMYNKWRDVRTAVDFLSDKSKDGYCRIKNFNPDLHVIKHVPQNDCALDIMMMLYHE